MRRPEPPDETPSRRLAALGLPRGGAPAGPAVAPAPPGPGWVPDQPTLKVADSDAAAGVPAQLRSWWADAVTHASSSALLALAGVCALCLAVTAWLLLHRPGQPAPAPVTPLPSLPAAAPAPTPAGVVVDVGGRVRHPGLVTLSPGARVADALRAAGGALRPHDLRLVDLAARVTDGELLLVGVQSGSAGATTGSASSDGGGGPVNLNTATVDQLDGLPGIGPELAQRILDWRSAHGGFRTVQDLNEVSGIGDATYADIAPLVVV